MKLVASRKFQKWLTVVNYTKQAEWGDFVIVSNFDVNRKHANEAGELWNGVVRRLFQIAVAILGGEVDDANYHLQNSHVKKTNWTPPSDWATEQTNEWWSGGPWPHTQRHRHDHSPSTVSHCLQHQYCSHFLCWNQFLKWITEYSTHVFFIHLNYWNRESHRLAHRKGVLILYCVVWATDRCTGSNFPTNEHERKY